jgi:hypothetical protein
MRETPTGGCQRAQSTEHLESVEAMTGEKPLSLSLLILPALAF